MAMAFAFAPASDRFTPNVRSGSASPTSPARSFSSAIEESILLNDARSAASSTRSTLIAAEASRPSPIDVNRFPNVPVVSSAACSAIPNESAAVAANASTTPADSLKTTSTLLADSARSDPAPSACFPIAISGALTNADIFRPQPVILAPAFSTIAETPSSPLFASPVCAPT